MCRKPYGIDENDADCGINQSCQCCQERIQKRLDKLTVDNYTETRRRITTPIYKEIPIDHIANILIDTCYMQRLRKISQLSFNNLLLPSANHNRFEHSLGTYYLACRICENEFFKQKLEEIVKIAFKISALLHDIGHGPFSHMSDELYKILNPGIVESPHEKRARNIIWKEIENEEEKKPACMKEILYNIFDKISPNGQSNITKNQFLRFINSAIMGTDPGNTLDTTGISLLLNGPIDIDKLDYMVRDAYYTGVPFGAAADIERICSNLSTKRNQDATNKDIKIVLSLKDISPTFNLFSSRFSAYISFIYHSVPLIAQEMILRELVDYFEDQTRNGLNWKITRYLQYDEKTFISKICSEQKSMKKIIFEIENRLLFKRVFCFIPKDEEYNDFKKRRDLEKKFGIPDISEKDIMVVFLPQVKFYPGDINKLYVKVCGKEKAISDVSFFKTANKLSKSAEVMICCRNNKNVIGRVVNNVNKIKETLEWEEITYEGKV